MTLLSVFAVAAGLSMDNFAVTIASGCKGPLPCSAHILRVSAVFVLAHIIMFSAGWFGGREVARIVAGWGNAVSFAVLAGIGIKMIYETVSAKAENSVSCAMSLKTLMLLAVATSIDALFVGMALCMASAPFWLTVGSMAVCVFMTSCSGFYLGARLGRRFGAVMEVLGGIVLIAVGIQTLCSMPVIW